MSLKMLKTAASPSNSVGVAEKKQPQVAARRCACISRLVTGVPRQFNQHLAAAVAVPGVEVGRSHAVDRRAVNFEGFAGPEPLL